ncbi:hypothetical protein [Flavobacterium sp. UBA4197]|uniref:hypothetical protein n=1 Tax=Flavobacterium sp. UBA4197 TaxID=1946546 RepID=UPI00257CA37C|nr:hypothetical protein [Flavobacterium sp. UBA4197]
MMKTANNLFWYKIIVKDEKHQWCSNLCLSWNNLPWAIRQKYDWYFKYRAALLQVQYPKFKIEQSWGSKAPDTKTAMAFLKDKIAGKKRMVTKLNNAIEDYVNSLEQTELFGVNGADKRLENTRDKLKKYEFELIQAEAEYNELSSKNKL